MSTSVLEVNFQKIPFDYAVIASGTRARSMLKPQAVSIPFRSSNIQQSILSSTCSSLLVVGSGPSAVEYAALARASKPDMHVTLCCDTPQLLPRLKSNAIHDIVFHKLSELGVSVRLGERIIGSGDNDGTLAVSGPSK